MTPAGRNVALDLLTLLGAAEITGPPHDRVTGVPLLLGRIHDPLVTGPA